MVTGLFLPRDGRNTFGGARPVGGVPQRRKLFDGFFADWMVLDRIQQSRRQVQETKSQIRSTLDYLRTLADQTAGERADVRRRIQELVDSVPM